MNATSERVPVSSGPAFRVCDEPLPHDQREHENRGAEKTLAKAARSEGRRENAVISPFPRARLLSGARWLRDHYYSQMYSWRGRANGNRDVDPGRALRKRPWEKEDPVSNQMLHEPFYPGRVAC